MESALLPFPDIDTPALLLEREALQHNIDTMQARAREAGLALRPHAKAHKCLEIGRLQRDAGAVGLCCAKLGEAEVMAAGGLDDLLVTTPVAGALKIARLVDLARRARVRVVADDAANLAELDAAAQAAGVTLGVVIEIDVGQGRCGVPPGPPAAELARLVLQARGLSFEGVQGYQGGLQCVADYAARESQVGQAMEALERSLAALREAGIAVPTITGGGTGSFPIDARLRRLTEVQPGSYVTMDAAYAAVQWTGGAAMPLARPLSILASVVSRPTRDKVIIDVGWKSANSDGMPPRCKNRPDLSFEFAGDEHGALVAASGEIDLRPGDRIELLPGHCDTTVNLYDRFVVHARGQVQAIWPIAARGKSH